MGLADGFGQEENPTQNCDSPQKIGSPIPFLDSAFIIFK